MLVFSSQPTELPLILAQDRPKSHGMTTVFNDYVLIYGTFYEMEQFYHLVVPLGLFWLRQSLVESRRFLREFVQPPTKLVFAE